jgi:hypothetical protein
MAIFRLMARRFQVLQVKTSAFEELLIFNIPDLLIGPAGNIGNELSKTPIGIPLA